MHILHLEDNGPLREILAAALKAVAPDCDLRQFTGSDDALAYAEKNISSIDLFILDIRVPGSIDGLQLAHKLRELKCSGVIVITSAFRVPSPELLEQLNCEWYPKPWHIFDTSERLLKLTREKREQVALAKAIESKQSDTPPLETSQPKTPEVVVPLQAETPVGKSEAPLAETKDVAAPALSGPAETKDVAVPALSGPAETKDVAAPSLSRPAETKMETKVELTTPLAPKDLVRAPFPPTQRPDSKHE